MHANVSERNATARGFSEELVGEIRSLRPAHYDRESRQTIRITIRLSPRLLSPTPPDVTEQRTAKRATRRIHEKRTRANGHRRTHLETYENFLSRGSLASTEYVCVGRSETFQWGRRRGEEIAGATRTDWATHRARAKWKNERASESVGPERVRERSFICVLCAE